MEIKGLSGAYGAKPYESSALSSKKAAPEKSAASQKEQLQLSSTSQTIQKVQETVNKLPEIRIPKVEEIKTKIKYNGYPMESNIYKAMKKMVENEILNSF